jgi:GPH family glycoside/pentoside/hexuronide:cation symporter
MADHSRKVPLRTKLFYGVGSVAYGVKDNGFSFFLLLYYSQVLGLSPTLAGTALMLALLVDAISDPLVGYISDNWHSRWGRRHPFMYFAALPLAICYAFLWNPPDSLGQQGLFLYLLCGAVLIRTLITLYEIPNTSMVAELTDDYDQRTSMLSFRYFFGWYGGLAMAALAYTVFLADTPEFPAGQLNPAGYRIYGLVGACAILASILTSSIGTHRYIPIMKKPRPKLPFQPGRVFRELAQTLSNRSFLALFLAGVFSAIAGGLTTNLNIYMNTYFWELTSGRIKYIIFFQFLSALIGASLAIFLTRRFDKKRAALGLIVFSILFGPAPVLLRLVGFFPGNESSWLLPILMFHGLVEVSVIVMIGIAVSSMIADIAEQNEIRTGRREEGLFFAARSFAAKATSGVGTFLAGVMLSLIAFPRDAEPGAVEPEIIFNLGFVYGPVLMVLYFISFAFITRYDISRSGHQSHLEALAEREQ